MEEGSNSNPNSNAAAAAAAAGGGGMGTSAAMQQQLLLMQQHAQQMRLLQHYQQQQQQLHHQQQQQQHHPSLGVHHQQQQQQASAISRFPSNIDAHLRAPGLRSLHLHHPQMAPAAQPHPPPPQQPQQQQARVSAGVGRAATDVEMAQQDAARVCNPDFKRPFSSIEDAVLRILPYHVVADYEAEEDDRILDTDTTGQVPSRLQQWDQNILNKIAEFTSTFEKQVLAFNIMSRKRALGEFRSEERLMLEQALLQDEKQALLGLRAAMESRDKAGREAAEAKMRMAMAQAEHARAEAQAHAEMIARSAPMRANAMVGHAADGLGQDMGHEQGGNMEEMIHGWGNAQRDEEDPSEDFLNDENEPENGEAGGQDDWREAGELDLNTR